MIIGIAGFKRSGKTTLATALVEHLNAAHTSFAAPIREFVAGLAGFESVDAMEPHKESPLAWLDGVTPRHMMQTLGTEWGRDLIHPALWVRLALDRPRDDHFLIVSDVRFPDEADAIHERGGLVLRVTRGQAAAVDGHASERPLAPAKVDFELENNGTINDLVDSAVLILNKAIASRRSQG